MSTFKPDVFNSLMEDFKGGKVSRRTLVKGAGSVGATATLMSFLADSSVVHAQAVEDGEIVIGISREPACWNPLEGPCGSDLRYHDLVMERLVVRDEEGNLTGGLASDWEIVDDLTWRFTLREGITFTNGEPFDAAAVQFMFEAVLEPEGRNPPPTMVGYYRAIESIEVVDDYTLLFHTEVPFPLLAAYMTKEPRAVPPSYYEEMGWEEFGTAPIGTGPYKLTERVPSEHFTLEANEDYWDGVPEIKKLTFRPIPEGATRVAELTTGGAQVVHEVPVELIANLEAISELSVDTLPAPRVVFVMLRDDEYSVGVEGTEIKQGLSLPMREAFQYATNFEPILNSVLGGIGELIPAGNPIQPNVFGFDPDIPDWPYDPDMARQKLEEAGYDGQEITMYYSIGSLAQIELVAQALQAQWLEVGLNVSIHGMESGVFGEHHRARTHPGDIYIASTAGSVQDSNDQLVPIVHSYDPDRGLGRISYMDNPEIDALIEESQTEVDPDKRLAILQEIWRLHRDTAHMITLYAPSQVFGRESRINWTPDPAELWSPLAKATISE